MKRDNEIDKRMRRSFFHCFVVRLERNEGFKSQALLSNTLDNCPNLPCVYYYLTCYYYLELHLMFKYKYKNRAHRFNFQFFEKYNFLSFWQNDSYDTRFSRVPGKEKPIYSSGKLTSYEAICLSPPPREATSFTRGRICPRMRGTWLLRERSRKLKVEHTRVGQQIMTCQREFEKLEESLLPFPPPPVSFSSLGRRRANLG